MTRKTTYHSLLASLVFISSIFFAFAKTNVNSESTSVSILIDQATALTPTPVHIGQNEEHKYYISVSNAKYNAAAKSVQMISRFFMDDMEDVLNARNSKTFVLGDPAQLSELQPFLEEYLQKKLKVKIDGTSRTPQLIGAEYESDQIVLYIEIPSKNPPKQISMSYTALIELFTEQKNLVHLKMNGVRKTLLMNNNKATDSVKF